jgi:Plasmid replication protein
MRARVWTFITYPDSLPDNFKEILEGETEPQHDIALVPIFISPCHDKDIAEDGKGWNGTPYKKPHYHNMVIFSQVKSYKQLLTMLKPLGVSNVSQVHSTQAMIRYFVHADHPEKAQYKREDIKALNGADLDNCFEVNDKEVNGILKQLINLIEDNDITEYHVMVKICMNDDEYFQKYFPLITGKFQFFVLNFIRSKRFDLQKNEPKSGN